MNSQQELINIIQDITKKNGGAYDTPATVLRVDGDTVWVHIDGGADETPVNKTIACEAGETVQVRIANGSAFLVGNASAPPTDDKRANAAHFIAEQATETATQAVESVEALSQTVKEDYVAAGDSNVHTLSSTMYQNANGVNIFNDELAAGDSYAHIDGDSFEIKQTVAAGVIDDVNDISLASFAENVRLGKEGDSHIEIDQSGISIIMYTDASSVEQEIKWEFNDNGLYYNPGTFAGPQMTLNESGLSFSAGSFDFLSYSDIGCSGYAAFSQSGSYPDHNSQYKTSIEGSKITSKCANSIPEKSTVIDVDKVSIKGDSKITVEDYWDANNKTEIHNGTIALSGEVEDLSGNQKYVSNPVTEGTAGQVLTTDGNGGRSWTTVSSSGVPEEYTFHILNTAASTAVAWCNKVVRFVATRDAIEGSDFNFNIAIKVGDTVESISFDNDVVPITSITLYDKATAKQTIASANFTYSYFIPNAKTIQLSFKVKGSFITSAIATALNAVRSSVSPGFACVYAANTLALTGTISGKGITEQIPGLSGLAYNAFPVFDHLTQFVGDFYLPTGGPRWNLEVEVDPGTAYYAVCYLVNTTTGAYFNHSIAYCGVGVPTIAAPTVAPAPVAGKTITFVGTTWSPFVAGVAGVVTDGVVTTKPRLRIQGYHASNTPTAGLGMHMRLFRIY